MTGASEMTATAFRDVSNRPPPSADRPDSSVWNSSRSRGSSPDASITCPSDGSGMSDTLKLVTLSDRNARPTARTAAQIAARAGARTPVAVRARGGRIRASSTAAIVARTTTAAATRM